MAPDPNFLRKVLFWVGVNCFASVTLTLANKRLSLLFPYPFTVISLQNFTVFSVCFIISLLQGRNPLASMTWQNIKDVKWVGGATAAVLTTSIVALRYAPVPLIVTIRNVTPMVTSFLEYLTLGRSFSGPAYLGLLCGMSGGLIYGLFDLPPAPKTPPQSSGENAFIMRHEFGIIFVVVNMMLSAIVSIFERTSMDTLKERNVNPTEVNMLRIFAMTPILMVLSFFLEDRNEIISTLQKDVQTLTIPQSMADIQALSVVGKGDGAGGGKITFYIVLTGVWAASFGIAVMSLTSLKMSPTTLAFLNIMYKIVTTALGALLFPVAVKWSSWFGYCLALVGFFIYIHDRNKGSPTVKGREDKKEK